ncbi:hypothetical protein [Micromonospora antibiotica]|uniref:Uncharacterized protein n=1 Tax=Micromonospora antibiotica TaxID=2807623 RepID=A0ABS3V4Q5_9ACTN|nr:hypothetical protein [Micromonospora antibiotica]MBO4160576.1 hypothetical protein [Micromonospora antibiotica]
MPELIAPAVQLYDAWREAHAEWGPGWHEDGFGAAVSSRASGTPGSVPPADYRFTLRG